MAEKSIAEKAENELALDALKKRALDKKLTRAEIAAVRRYEKRHAAAAREEVLTGASQVELCRVLDVKRQQVKRYEQKGMPRNPDGTYDLTRCVPWLKDHERELYEQQKEVNVTALEVRRQIAAEADALKLQEHKGDVAPVDHFESVIWRLFGGFKARLESWPRRVAKTKAQEKHLSKELKKLLGEFSDGTASLLEDTRPKRKRRRG